MTRKLLLALLLVASLGGASGCTAGSDGAATSSDDITVHHGGDVFESGVETWRLQFTASPDSFGRQRSSNWCWAADLQTVLRWHGLEVNQEQIVMRAFGGLIDRPQSASGIAATVNGWTLLDDGRIALVTAESSPLDLLRIRSELENDRPPILGLVNPDGSGGHAYVLTSIVYRIVPSPTTGLQMVPLFVKLRDPWPTNPNFLTLSWAEAQQRFAGLVFVNVHR